MKPQTVIAAPLATPTQVQEIVETITTKAASDLGAAADNEVEKDYVEKPLILETQITKVTTLKLQKTSSIPKTITGGKGISTFPFGYCTWYAASKRQVTWSGNARSWLRNAEVQGVPTGEEPRAGAIIVTAETALGHVGIVESVTDGMVIISEMNYAGFGKVSTRTLSEADARIRGYIY